MRSLDVLCRTLMIMIKIMLLEFILILFFVIIRPTTFSALKIGHNLKIFETEIKVTSSQNPHTIPLIYNT